MINVSVLHQFQNSLSNMDDKGVCVSPGMRVVMVPQACEASVKLVHAGCTNLPVVPGSQFVVLRMSSLASASPIRCMLNNIRTFHQLCVFFFFWRYSHVFLERVINDWQRFL